MPDWKYSRTAISVLQSKHSTNLSIGPSFLYVKETRRKNDYPIFGLRQAVVYTNLYIIPNRKLKFIVPNANPQSD